MPATTDTNDVQQLADLIDDFDTCMFVTDDNGTLRSRPMHPVGDVQERVLYFFSYDGSGKHTEIRDDSSVNLAFNDGKSTWVSLSGTARTVHDKAKEKDLWEPSMKAWFPDGLETPGMALIEVRLTQAEFWDQPNQTIVTLWGMAKAAVTGKSPDVGEQAKIDL